jgi:hypothetical protein
MADFPSSSTLELFIIFEVRPYVEVISLSEDIKVQRMCLKSTQYITDVVYTQRLYWILQVIQYFWRLLLKPNQNYSLP